MNQYKLTIYIKYIYYESCVMEIVCPTIRQGLAMPLCVAEHLIVSMIHAKTYVNIYTNTRVTRAEHMFKFRSLHCKNH